MRAATLPMYEDVENHIRWCGPGAEVNAPIKLPRAPLTNIKLVTPCKELLWTLLDLRQGQALVTSGCWRFPINSLNLPKPVQ